MHVLTCQWSVTALSWGCINRTSEYGNTSHLYELAFTSRWPLSACPWEGVGVVYIVLVYIKAEQYNKWKCLTNPGLAFQDRRARGCKMICVRSPRLALAVHRYLILASCMWSRAREWWAYAWPPAWRPDAFICGACLTVRLIMPTRAFGTVPLCDCARACMRRYTRVPLPWPWRLVSSWWVPCMGSLCTIAGAVHPQLRAVSLVACNLCSNCTIRQQSFELFMCFMFLCHSWARHHCDPISYHYKQLKGRKHFHVLKIYSQRVPGISFVLEEPNLRVRLSVTGARRARLEDE